MDRQWTAKWISSKEYVGLKPRNIYFRELPEDFNPQSPRWNKLPQHDMSLKNDHILVRKAFKLDKVDNAKLYISADDNYRLYINGKWIGLGPASNYYFHYFYNTYDISEYLNEGENIIAVHVFYSGTVDTRAFDSGDFRQGGTVKEGYKLNMPLVASRMEAKNGTICDNMTLLECENENIVIETIKKAEDDNSVIARMYDAYNQRGKATIKVNFPYKEVWVCDMLENNLEKLEAADGTVKVPVSNFEIVTLKFIR